MKYLSSKETLEALFGEKPVIFNGRIIGNPCDTERCYGSTIFPVESDSELMDDIYTRSFDNIYQGMFVCMNGVKLIDLKMTIKDEVAGLEGFCFFEDEHGKHHFNAVFDKATPNENPASRISMYLVGLWRPSGIEVMRYGKGVLRRN